MIIFIYDGTFDGLLTAIFESYYGPYKPDKILTAREHIPNLFAQEVVITTTTIKANRVYQAIEKKISPLALNWVYMAFLSESPQVGTAIYHYLQYGWQVGSKVNCQLAHPKVNTIHKLWQKVSREKHRMLGLVRFSQLAGQVYYAPMETDCYVLPLIAPHFAQRLADQHWIIHDKKRHVAAVFDGNHWFITADKITEQLILEKDELYFQNLWRAFHKKIAIQNRLNPKLQQQMMPKKYWPYLTEKN